MRTAFNQMLDVLRRFLGHFVDRKGDNEVHQGADCTKGFRRDAEEAVGAADQAAGSRCP